MGLGRVELPTSRLSGDAIQFLSPTFCRQRPISKLLPHHHLASRRPRHLSTPYDVTCRAMPPPMDNTTDNPRVPFNFFDFGRPPLFTYGNLVAARLHEDAGDTATALAAFRRRVIGVATYPHYVRYRREEGRLAASLGDTAGAIRAYRHYLALRSAPEPRLRAQADAVKNALAALLRAAGQH